ncbi:MAG: SdiA-regulated domain-containing protein [Armatimonadetes bacterium]|nr:SdiA-regulated domain-containing protein [Armatimonadota bacterium]
MKTTGYVRALSVICCGLLVVACGCSKKKSETPSATSKTETPALLPASSALAGYDFVAPPQFITLPSELDEVSGLATTPDGRLFTHNDENGTITEVDAATGSIRKQFQLDGKAASKDFEGIAIVGKRFFITTSAGVIFEFAEGKSGDAVPATAYQTELSTKNDIEGLCYDPATNALLLACKERAGKGFDDVKAVYAFSLDSMKLIPKPRFLLPMAQLLAASRGDEFNPSGIEFNPRSRSFFVVAAEGKSVVEVSPEGAILGQVKLDKFHRQAEGITFLGDGTLLISDEARGEDPTIARYPLRAAP